MVTEVRNGKIFGLSWGIAQATINMALGVLYLASGELYFRWPEAEVLQADSMFIAMFCILFGAFTAGQALQFGPDVVKAKQAAAKVFSIIERPSRIDVAGEDQKSATRIDRETFRGEIEFKDVWFRYPNPAGLHRWVFKGLNLKINKNDSIALVGESGSGKSTFINLVMRFYDPEFGMILLDGHDIRTYNIADMRERLGLVMQEPFLFNYSVKENVLYGKPEASNAEISKAVEIANASGFVEDNSLENRITDDPKSLLMHMSSAEFKAEVIEQYTRDIERSTQIELKKET